MWCGGMDVEVFGELLRIYNRMGAMRLKQTKYTIVTLLIIESHV